MPLKPQRRQSSWRGLTIILALLIAVLGFGTPLVAYGVPTPTPSETASASPVPDDKAAKKADPSESPHPSEAPTPAENDATASPTPSADQTASTEPSTSSETPSAEPSPKGPSAGPTAADSPTPKQTPGADTKAAAKEGDVRAQALVPGQPTATTSVVTVKTGGARGATATAVVPLAGVQLGLFTTQTGGTQIGTCTSDADGDCNFVVTDTGTGGGNRNQRFWVRQLSAPGGWYTNPTLRTGDSAGNTNTQTPYSFQTPALIGNNAYSSTTIYNPAFMLQSGDQNVPAASGGIWQSSRVNPVLPSACGLDVALILDLSGSVQSAGELANLKTAARTITDSLVGTPSRMSLFSFSTQSPAAGATQNFPGLTSVSTQTQADAFNSRFASWTATGNTNWDRAFAATAAAADSYDLAVLITDGNPTVYGQPAAGPGGSTRLREVENGIFSANALKAQGTRVLAFGVGGGATNTATALNLRAVSGTTAFTGSNGNVADYYQTSDYRTVGEAVRNLALGNCAGSISVTKQIVPSGNTGESISGAVPAGAGWVFIGTSTTTGIGLPSTQVTRPDGTGTVNFPLTFPGGVTSAPVTIKEMQQSGYTLVTQGTKNAVCRNLSDGSAVTVTNDATTPGQPGFSITATPSAPIACSVYNRAPQPRANVTVSKRWVINGTPFADGSQPDAFQAALSLTGPGIQTPTPQGWDVTREGYSVGDTTTIAETTTFARNELCTLNSSRVTLANGATVDQSVPYTPTLSQAANTYTITNTVTCTARLTLEKQVQFGTADVTSWNLRAIAPPGALAGPNGASGSAAATNVQVTPLVTYQLAESGGDPAFAQVDSRTDLQSNPLSTGSMTCQEVNAAGVVIPGFSDGINGGVTVPLGARVRCVALNQTATMRLVKEIVNDNGGTAVPTDWSLTLTPTGPLPLPPGVGPITKPGATLVDAQPFNLRPGITWSFSETGPPGYTNTSVECEIVSPREATTSVKLNAGESGVCWFENDDQQAHLSLVKVVDNGTTGGKAASASWKLSADGPTPVSGPGSSPKVTNQPVDPGNYVLSESGGPPGYTASNWFCTGGTLTGDTVAVVNGADVTCTIVNTARQAHLTLVKTVTNNNGGAAVSTDWTLSGAGPTTGISGVTGSRPVTNVSVDPGDYVLAESGPAGYAASAWTCDGGSISGSTVTVLLGQDVICTINNDDQPAHLTLVKTVTNDNGGTAGPTEWTLSATGGLTPITGTSGSPAVTNATVNAGSYTLAEANGPAGYTAGSWSCTGGGTLTGSSLVLPLNSSATCTIDNNDQPAHLTLVKTVTNDNGGTAAPTAWTLLATGPTPISGTTGSTAVTNAVVSTGTYALSESGPAGYAPGAWSCVGGTQAGNTIALALGQSATCTINNNDQQAHLTLIKNVDNGTTGATATPSQWTLSAAGPTPISGDGNSVAVTNQPVSPGSYVLSESGGPAGYDASSWSCAGGTLSGTTVAVLSGGDVTCQITNTAQVPRLTLVKVVDNGTTGAAAVPSDWTLSAASGGSIVTGPGNSTEVTNQVVQVGDWSLSETAGPAGYRPGTWLCTGGVAFVDTTVTVGPGNNVTCTITNSAQQAHLTLIKTVTNDNGGTAAPTAWTLTATGVTAGITGATGSTEVTNVAVSPDNYTLAESGGPLGYTPGPWTCVGGTLTGTAVAVGLGDNVTCTITNDDQQAHLTLAKQVNNPPDTGGTAVASDWTLTADSPTTDTDVTGPGNSGQVTRQLVDAGTYTLSESGGPDGYRPGSWSCGEGAGVIDSTVVVPNGGDVTCTISNTAEQAHLTLVKTVTNNDDGTAVPTDWVLSATGPTADVSGRTGGAAVTDRPVQTGSYTLAESGPTGYTAGAWTCRDAEGRDVTVTDGAVEVALGANVTCTINNDDELGTWNLAKSSDPASGTTVQPGATITYTVTATKTAGVNPVDVVINDDLSNVLNNATLVGGPTASVGTAEINGTTMTWTIDSLGGTETVAYQVRINDAAYGVTVGNQVTAVGSSTCSPENPGDGCSTSHPTPHYTLTKSSSPASGETVQPGGTITYTLTAHNDSQGVVSGAVVTDDLSDVVDNTSDPTITAGTGGSFTSPTLTWQVPTLQPGSRRRR